MKTFAAASLLALLALPASGLEPYLVKDVDPVPGPADSEPLSPVTLGDAVLFFAGDGVTRELWRSDGTSAGTFALTSGAGLSDPRPFLATEELYFFLSEPGILWVSDGTPAGTFPLTEPGVRVFSEPGSWRVWVASQGVLYFAASDAEHGFELWRSDGTPAGTHMVADIRPGNRTSNLQELTEYRGQVWFTANDGEHGLALWRGDGTAAGTVLAVDPVPSSASHAGPEFVQVVNGRLTFFALPPGRARSRQLWAGDGTARRTAPITRLAGSKKRPALVHDATVFGNRLYFLVEDSRGQELWVSDGTARGTRPLTGFPNATAFPFLMIQGMGVNGRFVFLADDGSHGAEPWVTDGTPQGTRLLQDVCPGICSSFTVLHRVLAGRLYFTASESPVDGSLWSTDGTPQGTRFVSDIPGSASSFFVVGNRLLFVGADEHGLELWRTDGTDAGTVRVTDFAERSFFDESQGFQGAVLDGQLLFGADDGEHGLELWRTDGTPPNTGLVEDINQVDLGGSSPRSLRPLGDEVIFMVGSAEALEMWKSDGTAAGTVPVRTFVPDEHYGARPAGAFAEAGGLLFYFSYEIGDRYVPWRTDGTAAGTFRLTNEGVPGCCDKQEMEAVAGTVFFDLWNEEHGRELWASDGTAAGTRLVLDLLPGRENSDPQELTAFNGKLWFSANGPGFGTEIWRSDGTAVGTVPVKDVNPGADGSRPLHLTVHAGRLWFFAEDGEHGRELWVSDGTAAGTSLAVELLPGPESYEALLMASIGDRLVFSLHGGGLWVSDGTPAGTRKIHDRDALFQSVWTVFEGRLYYVFDGIWVTDGTAAGTGPLLDSEGFPIYGPLSFAPLGGHLLFTAQHHLGGTFLWQTDGTPASTFPVHPPESIGDPTLVRAGDLVFFSGYDSATGYELWAVRP